MIDFEIQAGDCRTILPTLEAGSVQCCVTSPPYWGLRDYGHGEQLGLEKTPEEYVEALVGVFREVRRVLRDDGTLWLNLGDSYAVSGCAPPRPDHSGGDLLGTYGKQAYAAASTGPRRVMAPGLKPKDLVGIPWRVAFALQADGWYLRSDIIWAKPNPMPESVTDRPTKAHEYLFLLSKSARYYYDADAIAEPSLWPAGPWGLRDPRPGIDAPGNQGRGVIPTVPMRNRRSVWTVATEPYAQAHFAVMPTKLVEPCILAGSHKGDLVLDPFAGAGTVGLVANRLERRFLGCDLNPNYSEMARKRICQDAPLFNGAA